jgi:hypothetical protein
LSIPLVLLICICGIEPSIFPSNSRSNPFIIDITKIRSATPRVNPEIAIREIKDIKLVELSALKYLQPIKNGKIFSIIQ